jgi:hypothetical protein
VKKPLRIKGDDRLHLTVRFNQNPGIADRAAWRVAPCSSEIITTTFGLHRETNASQALGRQFAYPSESVCLALAIASLTLSTYTPRHMQQ